MAEQSRAAVLELLQAVKDPEIPVVSVVDLGVVDEIRFQEDGGVQVELIPTFAGCPAIGFMKLHVQEVLLAGGYPSAEVEIVYSRPWSSNRVTEKGRAELKAFGLAPPPVFEGEEADLEALAHTPCPRCDSTDTFQISPFGPTACRAVHHCNSCHETFEQFKPL